MLAGPPTLCVTLACYFPSVVSAVYNGVKDSTSLLWS